MIHSPHPCGSPFGQLRCANWLSCQFVMRFRNQWPNDKRTTKHIYLIIGQYTFNFNPNQIHRVTKRAQLAKTNNPKATSANDTDKLLSCATKPIIAGPARIPA